MHSYTGQEAIATGFGMNLEQTDYITMTYRGRGHAIAKGAQEKKLLAEMLGRVDGYCHGKGGPMHITSVENGILGANGIVGAGIPIAVGAAFSAQYRETSQVAVTYFGDGAINQGVFHEAINMAALWDLPVVFVCENNLYSEMTPLHESVKNQNLAERGFGYGVEGIVVDGNDLEAVYHAANEAVSKARAGKGPTLIEAKTYRTEGHMYGDSETYRTKEEVEAWRKKDPILQLEARLEQELADFHKYKQELEGRIAQHLTEAIQFAKESPEPNEQDLFEGVL
ncbi:pyruvate dehydrogenase E1 component alpha subunit [Cytobacillus purgationiresistens]|uniref:Pyruvate dehydrogenase E1 component alpha subunit n=1 Tax=Cytobacillus purgationiresistens TaxID=863449 RepID=A0ABU0AM86_9BACI|nr:pyruvate dehydrogenase E1 component alpha subunit [Cytobacillus purgationiresistens]